MARINVELPEAAVDLSSAFIVLPQAIAPAEAEKPPEVTGAQVSPPGGAAPTPAGPTAAPGVTAPTPPTATPQTTVRLSMRMNRQQLYASFNAIGNLAEVAGTIRMTVEAHKLDGFDPHWLRNAVREPLDEADVEVEE